MKSMLIEARKRFWITIQIQKDQYCFNGRITFRQNRWHKTQIQPTKNNFRYTKQTTHLPQSLVAN